MEIQYNRVVSEKESKVKEIDIIISDKNTTQKETSFLLACKEIYLRDIRNIKEINKQNGK